MKTMQAKYPGTCSRTGARINPGDVIVWLGRGKAYLAETMPSIDPDEAYAASIDPELAQSEPDAARAAGRYLRQSLARGVSDVWSSGGREYYRNRRGLCEDAPCCGCCNA